MTLEEILRVPTAASPEERADDVWDDENRCCYSADGEKLLDAENFPSEVTVREGCRILKLGHKNVTKKHPFQCGLEGAHVIFTPSCRSSPRLLDKDNKDESKDEYDVHSGFKLLPGTKMGN